MLLSIDVQLVKKRVNYVHEHICSQSLKLMTSPIVSCLLNSVQLPADTMMCSAVFGYFHGQSVEEMISD